MRHRIGHIPALRAASIACKSWERLYTKPKILARKNNLLFHCDTRPRVFSLIAIIGGNLHGDERVWALHFRWIKRPSSTKSHLKTKVVEVMVLVITYRRPKVCSGRYCGRYSQALTYTCSLSSYFRRATVVACRSPTFEVVEQPLLYAS